MASGEHLVFLGDSIATVHGFMREEDTAGVQSALRRLHTKGSTLIDGPAH
jgi:hypothetical protein